jgi:hypothetical protein
MSQIELVSRGDLDVFLTGNPSITFFKSVFRKHTNFSMEDMVIGEISNPKSSNRYAVKIPTGTGDLLYGTNLIIKGNRTYCGNGIANISTALIDNIAFSIGNREIDRTYGHYLEVYHELNQENPNHTITNLGRIEDSSLYHLAHAVDMAALATHKSMLNNNRSDVSYIDNSLAKPTNIMGHGLGYPPTRFQKSSKCGGTYCAPSYLQTQDSARTTTNNASHSSNFNYVSSINTRPTSSAHVSGLNRQRVDLRIVGYKTAQAGGDGSNYLVYTMDETASATAGPGNPANWINFNAGDKLKLISATGTAGHVTELTTSFVINAEKEVIYQDGNKIYIKDLSVGSTGDADINKVVDATFKLTQENWSGRLLNASQVAESALKGDILGECILPLNFWYCRSPGLSIPLIALNRGLDVELYIQFAGESDADWTTNANVDAITTANNKFISYDQNINNLNDITNAYKIGTGDSDVKPIYNNTAKNFNFKMQVSVMYIFLDNMERQRFQNSSHEYLIEQLQYHAENSQTKLDINISPFQHPVKEIIWCGQPYLKDNINSLSATSDGTVVSDAAAGAVKLNDGTDAHSSGVRFVAGLGNSVNDQDILYGGGIRNVGYSKGFGNASFSDTLDADGTYESKIVASTTEVPWTANGKFVQGLLGPSTPDCLNYCSYKIELNGTDRCQWKPLQYFTRENVRKYHKGGCISVPDSIAVFSFALDPMDTAPSGTCNFTNIDSKIIKRNINAGDGGPKYKKINVYAINYNILRFVNGQAGLAYVL